jgi:hypothetical protein
MTDENTKTVIRVDNGKPRANPLRVHLMVTEPDEKGDYKTACEQTINICNSDLTDDAVSCQICKSRSKNNGWVQLDEDQSLPSFARVDIARKPEVGRWYDGYKVGQQDMRKERFRRVKLNE